MEIGHRPRTNFSRYAITKVGKKLFSFFFLLIKLPKSDFEISKTGRVIKIYSNDSA